ncbi:33701_t:CDS:2 [Racocetra persica]|uniref:33701_t:CDS:1 n=1 Tax=Racocetra persica TaxID=160502 RepID=A0ACA9M7Z0_9GLOM|nr:33701_t:CDS:2 [Racocetra persica]
MANNISIDFSYTDLNVNIFDTFNEEQSGKIFLDYVYKICSDTLAILATTFKFMTHNISTISTDCFLNSSILSEEFMDLNKTQQSDYESEHDIDENIKLTIYNSATFCNWKSLEDALKEYELNIGFKDYQPKKKANTTCQREKESKKVGCAWQLNAEYQKNFGAIVINKFVEEHNYPLALHRKEFVPSLYSLSQEVLDTIKFLTQECNLEAKA